ncbi:MAG: Cro/CI family transcriptional regulator [Pseudomonadota bacterium]|uniref:Cro/CI family transcriptional regulator n=1 Tax=Serratia fonticola TaxID=47917 RepID=UPI00217A384D|nr:Cro/CI family transcriptional regulator [Serratia fonticola]CAI1590301.1 DNA-binding transcriptional regulator DicC [Serratia fonticola]CAI1923677.1 DNA-binding transcriptional regulator DicC [Serratia fonticola]
MLKDHAIEFFVSKTKLAKAAGVSQAAVSRWGDLIPERCAARLEKVTGGALKYDPALYGGEKHSPDAA